MSRQARPHLGVSARRWAFGSILAMPFLAVWGCSPSGVSAESAAGSGHGVGVLLHAGGDVQSRGAIERVTAEFTESLIKGGVENVVKLRMPPGTAFSVKQVLSAAEGRGAGHVILGSLAPGSGGLRLSVELYAPPSGRILWMGDSPMEPGAVAALAAEVQSQLR